MTIIHLQMYNYLHQINKQMGLKMTKQMTVTELKNLMNLSGWTHEQVITINKEYDYNGHVLEGIAEVVSRNPKFRSKFILTKVLSTTLKKTNSRLRKTILSTAFGGSRLNSKLSITKAKRLTLGI